LIIGGKLKGPTVSSVVVDNVAGSIAAVQHLYGLGHRKIAFIRGPKALCDSAPRWKGISGFARQSRLRIDPALVVEIQGETSTYATGVELTEKLLKRGKPFTALVSFDDLTAFAAIGALTKHGLRVPRDCSVIGFDDVPGARFYNPPLTTVNQHLEKQGVMAAEMIRELISARDKGESGRPLHRRIMPKLVVRHSTAPIHQTAQASA
jgi:LacI family transcriptional regulator